LYFLSDDIRCQTAKQELAELLEEELKADAFRRLVCIAAELLDSGSCLVYDFTIPRTTAKLKSPLCIIKTAHIDLLLTLP
jgi:hypothetical protein